MYKYAWRIIGNIQTREWCHRDQSESQELRICLSDLAQIDNDDIYDGIYA